MNRLSGLFHNKQNSLFVEQAEKPVLENGARCEVLPKAQHAIDNYI
ncbi:hypothetical protein QUB16_28200 [Microcoleus sp. D3_18a_C4]